jgi:hypothetical protein
MKQPYRVALAVAAAILLAAAAHIWQDSSQAPSGQPSLTDLTPANFDQFRHVFNAHTDAVRMVLLLSPT